jgi:alkylation response protein AidB-like acyl-CoA dehydrogenase
MQEKGGLAIAASVASESKLFGSELTRRLSDIALEIMGMSGLLKDSKWAPCHGNFADLYELSTGYTIGGGTSEIQRNLIAWVGLHLPRFK